MCRRFCWCLALFFLCCSCLVLPGVASDASIEEPSVSELPVDDLPSEDDGIDPQAGGRYYYGYIGMSPDDGVIMVTQGTSTGSTVLAQLDLKAFMAEQGYLTAANMTQVERYLSEISNKITLLSNDLIGYFGELSAKLDMVNDSIIDVHTRLGVMNTTLSAISTGITTANSTLTTIRNYLSGSSSGPLTYIRDYLSGARTGPLTYIRQHLSGSLEGPLTVIRDRLVASPDIFYHAPSNMMTPEHPTEMSLPELVDLRSVEIENLLLRNIGKSFSFRYLPNWDTGAELPEGSSLLDVLSAIGSTLYVNSFSRDVYLDPGGFSTSPRSVERFNTMLLGSFVGLNLNMENALVGGHGGSASYSKLTFDSKLNKVQSTVSYKDLLHAMVGIGSDLQNPLSQLQAVLAGDDDLELRQNVQDNVNSVTDNFTGDGAGSVSTGDISDAAGLTSGVGDAFGGNQVSTGDVFRVVGDADNYGFFSQATAEALDSVAYPAVMPLSFDDDSWLDAYSVDEDGFYYLSDTSSWNILDYLGRED